ncbi:hypothetical protein THMIRHAS_24920 [Thiosulfatimonas sediminis]|uniref:NfeD-like C-terminal domain-containing protein n=1 Tax=Thiosulfatimonas sediminis TaxID=2675054 RepID=A0A6F8PYB9_9GAMM|nr:NfeD family protein [Thiosulfatimonas sediminis]BBP47119.1 hypothetical protein THMIRHAS_24920 [Thiosulfatimonas sediminis]
MDQLQFPILNHGFLLGLGAVLFAFGILLLKKWLKTLGFSLVLLGAAGFLLAIENGFYQLIFFLMLWVLAHQLGKKPRLGIRLADEHQEGGTGIIRRANGNLSVVYKDRSWPIQTDEDNLKEGDRVVVIDIVNGRANVELLSRKSVHAED